MNRLPSTALQQNVEISFFPLLWFLGCVNRKYKGLTPSNPNITKLLTFLKENATFRFV